jgi:hypothetical protein
MGRIWELDFYSRPIVDEQQKKLWEVLICESPEDVRDRADTLFRYSQFCSSTQVNSVWLRTAVEEALAQVPQPPDKIRFFRSPMANMITKACEEVGIPAQLSRRTYTLNQWLQKRLTEVYPTDERYQPGSSPTVNSPLSNPQPLPDALVGQKWAFVTLQCQDLNEMPEWSVDFGEAFPLQMMGLTPNTPIPGIVIFSQRALPLAAWMSGLDLAFIKLDVQPSPALGKSPARLLLETGGSDRWILASFTDSQTLNEAQAFEAAKQQAQNVHFLAIQADPQSEKFTGFWLLQDSNLA